MKSPFAPPYATMQEKIDQMHLHCKSIDEENKLKDERNHCNPLVDNDVLLSALNQRYALLEALESALKTAEFEKHPLRPWHDKARAAIAAARGEL